MIESNQNEWVREAQFGVEEDSEWHDPPAKRSLIAGYPQAHCLVLEGAEDRPLRVYLLREPNQVEAFYVARAGRRLLALALLMDALGDAGMAHELYERFVERTVAHWDWQQGVSITAATIRDVAADLRAGGEYADPFSD